MKAHMSTEGLREALRTTVIDLVLSKVDSLKAVSDQYMVH